MAKEIPDLDSADFATFRGIRIEDPAQDNAKWKALALTTEAVSRLRRAKISGALPHEGPALIFSNHVKFSDVFTIPWLATKTAGRSLRIVSRDTLIHPEIEDEVHVLRRTGKLPEYQPPIEEQPIIEDIGDSEIQQMYPYGNEDDLKEPKKSSSIKGVIKHKVGSLLDSAGHPILIHRGTPITRAFIDEVRETLESGQMVAIFAQETRTKQDDITNLMRGPAVLLKRYFPDTPAYLVTVANQGKLHRRISIRVSDDLSYRKLSENGDIPLRELHKIIRDTMYNQLVQDVPNLKA